MHQVVFHFPFIGYPLFSFGAMLLLAFVVVVGWGRWRSPKIGLSWERFQDFCMLMLASGLAGARIVYMWQYSDQFPDKSPFSLFLAFFRIWDGGIVFYGSIFGGLLGFWIFRKRVLKPLGVNGWQLADAVAPMLAIGMAIGRIGCYLNGCCWGQVACPECQPMPLPPELGQFPLLAAHAKRQVTWPPDDDARLPQIHGLQTTVGFSIPSRDYVTRDPRSLVLAVEPGGAAERAGLRPGDRIVEFNGETNRFLIEITGSAKTLADAADRAAESGAQVRRVERPGKIAAILAETDDPEILSVVRGRLSALGTQGTVATHDSLYEFVRGGPLGAKRLDLVVERDGQRVPIAFTPRTVTFFPTQVYETISMVLVAILLIAFQPFRRHDGQVIVVLMLCYAVHRFLNEAIRTEPTYGFGLTLSQWISIGIFLAAIGLELALRRTQPKLPPGAIPLGYGARPIPSGSAATGV
jgi:phosphatidylglycerol---prolipoprotein diacylglyceryl transferase